MKTETARDFRNRPARLCRRPAGRPSAGRGRGVARGPPGTGRRGAELAAPERGPHRPVRPRSTARPIPATAQPARASPAASAAAASWIAGRRRRGAARRHRRRRRLGRPRLRPPAEAAATPDRQRDHRACALRQGEPPRRRGRGGRPAAPGLVAVQPDRAPDRSARTSRPTASRWSAAGCCRAMTRSDGPAAQLMYENAVGGARDGLHHRRRCPTRPRPRSSPPAPTSMPSTGPTTRSPAPSSATCPRRR